MFQRAFTYSGTLWYPCKESWPRGPALVIPRGDLLCWKFIDILKSQKTNPKKQTNNNDRNSKSQTKKQSLTRRKRLRCALNRFGIWNLEFEIYLEFGAWNL